VAVCWALAGIFIDQWNGGNVLVLGLAAIGFIMIALRALFAARS
jgi:threonine dehydrogenase-like Zn-dependent dehydrogenase